MKTTFKLGTLVLAFSIFISCQQQDNELQPELQDVPGEVLDQIDALGYNPNEVKMYNDILLIEGDIRLTLEELNELSSKPLPITEHYSTNNLVTGTPRTINVFVNMGQKYKDATDIALARYNSLGLGLSFTRVNSSSSADITIKASPFWYYWFGILGSAGFPEGGNPHNEILMTSQYYDGVANINGLATTIAHEMGHCLGFRHTDYMDRSYSCGGSTNDEGDGGVGANHIPGTSTGPSADSWMLACGSPEGDRPFTEEDVTALEWVY